MSIRVASGEFKGRILKTLPGQATRPTTGKVRESIFSILQHDIEGARVLDMFAGSGGLSIEAISRGAASAVLIEKSKKAVGIIKQNLKLCGLNQRILAVDYKTGLRILADEGAAFDLIFADPPYGKIPPNELFELIKKYSLFSENGLFIMEHSPEFTPESDVAVRHRRFGDSAITIYACQ